MAVTRCGWAKQLPRPPQVRGLVFLMQLEMRAARHTFCTELETRRSSRLDAAGLTSSSLHSDVRHSVDHQRTGLLRPVLGVRVNCHERVFCAPQAAPACATRSAHGHFGRYHSFVRLGGFSGLGDCLHPRRIDLSDVARIRHKVRPNLWPLVASSRPGARR
jgi:hypothetical protein